ncbi:ABC transporter permease [Limisphaera sp. 4302-co]|uniref:ABC transporter permease n=1 Tax=Limisphaera sp. 4302-co TaxID=3400417 RepID=UPI003C2A665B
MSTGTHASLRQSGRWMHGLAAFVYLFLYAPLVLVTVQSFNAGRFGTRWEGFTTAWYRALPHNQTAWEASRNTLVLALTSTTLATVLGTTLACGLSRGRFPCSQALQRAISLSVFLPDILLAAALLLAMAVVQSWCSWVRPGLPAMIAAHVTFQLPFVALVVRARLARLDPALEEAARDLGASGWQLFYHVTLPLLRPGILAGALLAFTLSLDDFIVSFFTTGPGATTLPIWIYASAKRGLSPEVHALSTLLILASLILTVSLNLVQRKPWTPG